MIKLAAFVLVALASVTSPFSCSGSNGQPDGPGNIVAPASAK